jgi:hypothetical protein
MLITLLWLTGKHSFYSNGLSVFLIKGLANTEPFIIYYSESIEKNHH